MAMDFPSGPTVGQIVTLGGNQYIWDGTAWNIIPQQAPAALSDLPPANPAVGQFWWRATNGQLYVYVNDGNSSQWVQAAGQGITPGMWEFIETRVISGSPSQLDFINLGAFESLKLTGRVFATGSTGNWFLRTSTDNGVSFAASAADYSYQITQFQGATATPSSGTLSGMPFGYSAGAIGVEFEIILGGFNTTMQTYMRETVYGVTAASTTFTAINGAQRSATEINNALRIFLGAGTLTNGKIYLEGVRG